MPLPAVTRVVPVPSASGTTALSTRPAPIRAASRSSGRSAGRSPSSAARGIPTPAASAPTATAVSMPRARPVPSSSGTNRSPGMSKASATRAPSSVTTYTWSTDGHAAAAAIVSSAIARARVTRSTVASSSRDLPTAVGLTGMMTAQPGFCAPVTLPTARPCRTERAGAGGSRRRTCGGTPPGRVRDRGTRGGGSPCRRTARSSRRARRGRSRR